MIGGGREVDLRGLDNADTRNVHNTLVKLGDLYVCRSICNNRWMNHIVHSQVEHWFDTLARHTTAGTTCGVRHA